MVLWIGLRRTTNHIVFPTYWNYLLAINHVLSLQATTNTKKRSNHLIGNY